MPASKSSRSSRSNRSKVATTLFDWPVSSWLDGSLPYLADPKSEGKSGLLVILDSVQVLDRELKRLKLTLPTWQKEDIQKKKKGVFSIALDDGPVWIVVLENNDAKISRSSLETSTYGKTRDLTGNVVTQIDALSLQTLKIDMTTCHDEATLGFLVGLEIASYSYMKAVGGGRSSNNNGTNQSRLPRLEFLNIEDGLIEQARHLGIATNIARHLVNTPANIAHPEDYASMVESLLGSAPHTKVDVWDENRLTKERMNLLLAVGQAAVSAPRLVHIRYRPKHAPKGAKPLAFVGKGVTFDSGGLDIKPSAGMRFMKKDMGGSAALVGLAWWITQTEQPIPCDIYLAMAENAVAGNAFRPGDTIVSRAGISVEIHNTDAEGRLVMADAFDVAVSASGVDEPALLINVATLTGAVKVGLGADIIGYFANDDKLASSLEDAAAEMGEPMWRLPLYDPYMKQMKSVVADMTNCSASPWGGAMTAALFLKRFTKNKPWAHLDIYAWADGANGAIREAGGSGQTVQLLASYFETLGQKR